MQLFSRILDTDSYQEYHNALTMLVVGCWWIVRWNCSVPVNSSAFTVMSDVAPAPVWGIVMIAQSWFQLWSLLVNSGTGRRAACLVSIVVWGFLSVFFYLAGRNLFAVPVSFMLATGSAWGYIHLGRSINAVPDSRRQSLS